MPRPRAAESERFLTAGLEIDGDIGHDAPLTARLGSAPAGLPQIDPEAVDIGLGESGKGSTCRTPDRPWCAPPARLFSSSARVVKRDRALTRLSRSIVERGVRGVPAHEF